MYYMNENNKISNWAKRRTEQRSLYSLRDERLAILYLIFFKSWSPWKKKKRFTIRAVSGQHLSEGTRRYVSTFLIWISRCKRRECYLNLNFQMNFQQYFDMSQMTTIYLYILAIVEIYFFRYSYINFNSQKESGRNNSVYKQKRLEKW